MGFLDEVRKKNRLAKSLVSNGLAPGFDVAIKMAEARMRVESGAQDPIESANAGAGAQPSSMTSTNLSGLRNAVAVASAKALQKEMSLDDQRKASIMMYNPTTIKDEVKHVQSNMTTTQQQDEGTKMAMDVERILAENTKFITEQLIDFKSQLASLAATMENMKQDFGSVKQEVISLKAQSRAQVSNNSSNESRGSASSAPAQHEAHTDSSGEQHFIVHPPNDNTESHKEHRDNPRGDPSKINHEDVSIEKMFNFSHKKF